MGKGIAYTGALQVLKAKGQLDRDGKAISLYVFNLETISFHLDTAWEIGVFRDQAEPRRNEVGDFFDHAYLMDTVLSSQDKHPHNDDLQRTIYIDTLGVRTTDFDLDEGKK